MNQDPYTPAALSARVDRLERQNRRLVRIALACGVLGLASAAAPLCKTVRGERFVLEDSHGRGRVVLDAYSTPNPRMTLFDKHGEEAARLHVADDGGIDLEVFREDGEPTRTSLTGKKSRDKIGVE